MLPEQHDYLIRFGDILFLDAQKRDMNKPGWPYIGPVVKDSELQVRTVCECLCISESIEIYQWILNKLTVMEPEFHIEHIRLIFADQLVTKTLLTKGIYYILYFLLNLIQKRIDYIVSYDHI